jgi:hypothetical protein
MACGADPMTARGIAGQSRIRRIHTDAAARGVDRTKASLGREIEPWDVSQFWQFRSSRT